MKRIKVQLKQLKPNPYKKEIRDGFIDEIVVAQIKESASKTSFWEQWVVRKNKNGEYELAFGHHRLAAALQLFGPEYEVSVQVEDYTDEQMLIALADENAGNEESIEAQVDVIRIAKAYLIAHPETGRVSLDGQAKLGGRPPEPGSERHLLAFLGKANWNAQKIHTLVSIADRFDAELLKDVANYDDDGPEHQRTICVSTAAEIAKLEKPAQKVVVQAIKKANSDLQTFKDTELAERREKSLPSSGIKDMSTHIPAPIIKQAVKKAADVPPAKQAQTVVNHIKQVVVERTRDAVDASLPNAESVVSKIAAQLYNFPDDATMQELLGNRELLSVYGKKSLQTALRKHIERLTAYEDTLVSPPLIRRSQRHGSNALLGSGGSIGP